MGTEAADEARADADLAASKEASGQLACGRLCRWAVSRLQIGDAMAPFAVRSNALSEWDTAEQRRGR
jgi:hypothetical protein